MADTKKKAPKADKAPVAEKKPAKAAAPADKAVSSPQAGTPDKPAAKKTTKKTEKKA